ncbi:hypothetical protein EK21DRAFT_95126 [Setomelanomma holmii]|uniref:Uncharacterized protein n=1 Tax=Setomelanomma holmii TaxID=210430 RepID=A0A9P4GXE0_9PLEO|nr:hypothetical protein EK21DRAFT_95126 [Setomelanomma holmii]
MTNLRSLRNQLDGSVKRLCGNFLNAAHKDTIAKKKEGVAGSPREDTRASGRRHEHKLDVRQARTRGDSSYISRAPTPDEIETSSADRPAPVGRITEDDRAATLSPQKRKREQAEDVGAKGPKKLRLSRPGKSQYGVKEAVEVKIAKPTGGPRGGVKVAGTPLETKPGTVPGTVVWEHEAGTDAAAAASTLVHPLSPPATPEDDVKLPKSSKMTKPKRPWQNPRIRPAENFAPVHPNIEHDVEFAPYDDYSVPILESAHIEHAARSAALLNNPSIPLKLEALGLLDRGLNANDLGRSKVPRSGPTRIIQDCDLYLRDGQIHVASERGTLLAATYLNYIGVLDTTPVRFDGMKPAWAKASLAQRRFRRVEDATARDDPWYVLNEFETVERKEGLPELPAGYLAVDASCIVEILEMSPDGICYGRRQDNGEIGLFDYKGTRALDEHYGVKGVFEPVNFSEMPPYWLIEFERRRETEELARSQAATAVEIGSLSNVFTAVTEQTTSHPKVIPEELKASEQEMSAIGEEIEKESIKSPPKVVAKKREDEPPAQNTSGLPAKEVVVTSPPKERPKPSTPAPYGAVEDEVDWDDD